MKRLLKLKDIEFDKGIYPREEYAWKTSYNYQLALQSGAEFPPIIVGLFENRYYLIDGVHRYFAYKNNKETHIQAIVKKGLSKKEMYILAVELNITHGRPFSPYEKAKIMARLENYKIEPVEIAKLVHFPLAKMIRFKASRIAYSPTGEPIVLKAPVKHLHDTTIENINHLDNLQNTYSSISQIAILNELISLIKNNLINIKDDKIFAKMIELKNLIHEKI